MLYNTSMALWCGQMSHRSTLLEDLYSTHCHYCACTQHCHRENWCHKIRSHFWNTWGGGNCCHDQAKSNNLTFLAERWWQKDTRDISGPPKVMACPLPAI